MQQAASHVPLSLSPILSLCVCPLSISPCRCLFLWLLNCLRESSERQRSEEIIMRCALSYFDLGHVSHNSSGPLSPSSLPCFPALPPPSLPIIFAIVEFSSVVCLSCSWSHESFGRTISVELIGIGSTSGYPTITLPYHVFFRFFFLHTGNYLNNAPDKPLKPLSALPLRVFGFLLLCNPFVSFIHRVLGLFIVFPSHATLFSNCLLHSCHTCSACSALSILSELITFSLSTPLYAGQKQASSMPQQQNWKYFCLYEQQYLGNCMSKGSQIWWQCVLLLPENIQISTRLLTPLEISKYWV